MHHYDDPNYNYQTYWKNRDYEHFSEVLAIESLLKNKQFKSMADVGGGFGRLYPTFSKFTKKYILLEPSQKLRQLAKKSFSSITVRHAFSHKLPLRTNSQDLVSLIRVSHHLVNLDQTFKETYRVLKPDGYFLLEFANSANFKNRIKHFFAPLPIVPIEKRSQANISKKTIDFVNHHPQSVIKSLQASGFKIVKSLSVSNFRSPFLKKFIPINILLKFESLTQNIFASFYYGPSIFVLLKKAS